MATAQTDDVKCVYEYPLSLRDVKMRFCPGCMHGVGHRLVAEVIDELGVEDRAVLCASVGCSVFAYEYFDLDALQVSHGRAPAVATGVKRVSPESIVFAYQGDGDLASIGISEVIHAAGRGERITIVFVNNAVYGMTQGQMAPTTLLGMKTTTTPTGRTFEANGMPMQVCELLDAMPGVAYLARAALIDPKHIRQAKRYLTKAFQAQIDNAGFSLVELVSTCPTWWQMTPLQATEFVRNEMLPVYPLGEFRDWSREQGDNA